MSTKLSATAILLKGVLVLFNTLALLTVHPMFKKLSAQPSEICPYLNQQSDEDTSSTKAIYDNNSKVLNIQVERTVPDLFWSIAESRTRKRVSKILEECPMISMVNVTFKSGQKITIKRPSEDK
jgi:hypothetical protein